MPAKAINRRTINPLFPFARNYYTVFERRFDFVVDFLQYILCDWRGRVGRFGACERSDLPERQKRKIKSSAQQLNL